jgi:ADP-ribose pyrophosphatase YjhB (NUDIX family)
MSDRQRHCSYCGQSFGRLRAWPRTCAGCGQTTYRNPLPVVVVLLPITDVGGLLAVRRAIEPGLGKLALPGGYIDWADATWKDAGARELREETGIRVRPASLSEFRVLSAPDHKLIVFALARGVASSALPASLTNDEISELTVLTRPTRLAFSTHTQVVREYFTNPPTGASVFSRGSQNRG